MNLFKLIFSISISMVLMASCSDIFYTSDSKELAFSHQSIAILPSTITITTNRKVEVALIQEQERIESLNFQKEIFLWLQESQMQGSFTKDIQKLEVTNAELYNAGYPENSLTIDELCEILGVDGVISSSFELFKPISKPVLETVLFLASGFYGGSNHQIKAGMSISDCENSKLIWNYEHESSSTEESSPATIVDKFMRKISRKMPYILN